MRGNGTVHLGHPSRDEADDPGPGSSRVLALVPHFRCERWLEHCLASLVEQTRPLDGVVVIDDASPEPPEEIVSRFPEVTLLRAADNVGPYRLVQQVMEETRYDRYLFQDADDWSAPERLERLLTVSRRRGAELIGSDYLMLCTDEGSTLLHTFPTDVNAALAQAPTCHALQHPTSLVARPLVEGLGGYASGMRFSGDDEFLRRAAHVTTVANVPEVLYYRRHRKESLTTSAETGHGSAARRSVLDALASRARANAEGVAKGERPLLEPYAQAPPVSLVHVCGPDLEGMGRSGTDRRVLRSVSLLRPPEPRSNGTRPEAADPLEPVLVVGTRASGAEALVWSLAQHPALVPVVDLSWLDPLAASVKQAGQASATRHEAMSPHRSLRPLDALGAGPEELRAVLVDAVQRLLLAGSGDDPRGGGRGWVAAVGSDRERVRAVLDVFPGARVVHVLRPPEEAVAALAGRSKANPTPLTPADACRCWLKEVRHCLAIERAVGAAQLLRVPFPELVARPEEVLGRCLAFVGVEHDDRCTRPLVSLDLPDLTPGVPIEAAARDLGTALCGPPAEGGAAASEQVSATAPERPARGVEGPHQEPPAPSAAAAVTQPGAHLVGPAALLRDRVPQGAVVAMVTKGEGRLLASADHEVWHFPQTTDGEWAGYHPATTDEIVAHLDHLVARGAAYFLIPSWASWWLDHYQGLRHHLEERGRLVGEVPEQGTVFQVTGGEVGARPAPAPVVAPPPVPANRVASSPGRRRSVSVLAWCVAHNPLGRAHVLAELLRDRYDVELVGAEFERFGTGIWPPLRDIDLPLRTFPGGAFPDYLARMEAFARSITSDALVVSKPRLPSYLLGIMAKALDDRPLVLDVDDWELSFVGANEPAGIDDLRRHADDASLLNPYGRHWTQHCESLIGAADAVTVSNQRLQARFGGTIVPHARDERLFDPGRFDRGEVRRRFGFAEGERVVVFAGTPRRHKGVLELASALRESGDPRARLCLIGTAELEGMQVELAPYADLLRVVPYQPFGELPALLAAADLVAVLQDPTSDVSQYQMPAKVSDALAMQRPCLVRSVPPLEPLIAGGHLEAVGAGGLSAKVAEMLADDGGHIAERARANRELFLSTFSFSAVRPRLEAMIDELLDRPTPLVEGHRRVLAFSRELFASGGGVGLDAAAPAPTAPATPTSMAVSAGSPGEGAFDVVMFWKQHDTGIYGRRHDMLMENLARSPQVGQVVQFDAPVELAELRREVAEDLPSHAGLVRERTMQRLGGVEAVPGLHQYSFLYHDGDGPGVLPCRDDYLDCVRDALARHGVGDRPVVFWVYPKSFDFPPLARALAPDAIVADVVDDHRTWARPDTRNYDRIVENYAEIAGLSDLVLTNCETMRATMATMSDRVHLVPNAAEHPDPVLDEPLDVPADLDGRKGPVIGYVGNLSSRIDVDLLEHLATCRPDWQVVLVGSAHAGQEVLRLRRLANVSLLGPRPYQEAKRYIRSFDVAIIPHLDGPMTSAMHPLKAFVYCALNVPVVSTDIANLGELRPLISVATDHDDFVARIDEALRAGSRPLDGPDADGVLQRNSWSARTETVVALVEDTLRQRGVLV